MKRWKLSWFSKPANSGRLPRLHAARGEWIERKEAVVDAIRAQDIAKSNAAISELCEWLGQQSDATGVHLSYMACMVLMDIEKMIHELNIDRKAVFKREPSMFLLADSCRSAEEMRRMLSESSEKLIVLLNAKPLALKSSIIKPVVEYLQQHYMDEHISLESTAVRFCINPSYLGQLMKRELGKTFLQYISEIRIGRAKDGLAGSNKPIQQIAVESGYSNRSTFIRVFKNLVGITPSEYRNRVMRDDGIRMNAADGR